MAAKYVTDCEFCHQQDIGVTRDWNLSKDKREGAPWRVSRHFESDTKKVCTGTRIVVPEQKVRTRPLFV